MLLSISGMILLHPIKRKLSRGRLVGVDIVVFRNFLSFVSKGTSIMNVTHVEKLVN